MNCSLEQSEDTTTLFISGSMSIEDAANLKTALAGVIADSSRIEVDLKAVAAIDLSCLQVLCSAHRAAVHSGKKLSIRSTSEALLFCLEDAGFPRHSGCLQQQGESCLWQEVILP